MLVIEGRAYLEGQLESVALGIEDGTIVAIKKTLRGDKTYRFGDAILLPGGIDVHVHFREPGKTHKEDFASGTESAAVGGVTTVVDMPNTRPPVTKGDVLREKLRVVSRHANVDFGLYGAPASAADVKSLADAMAYKAYLAETTDAPLIPDDAALTDLLAGVASTKTYVSVHAEDPGRFQSLPAKKLEDYHRARPPEAEKSAIETVGRLRGEARVHIAHVTTAEAVKARPAGVTCEVTPHHLLLTTASPIGALGKVNPPLRPIAERENLWREVVAGSVDMFASDHAPHTLDEKSVPFDEAPAGVPGVATTFPVLFRYVRRDVLPLPRFVAMFSENPAKLLRVNKGTLAVGRDADLIVVDPRRIEKMTARRCRYKCGWTPFEGAESTFPVATFVRGQLVSQEGELVTESAGRLITPSEL